MTTTLTGPDASHHQGTVDWAAVRRAGHSYAFVKATEGTSYGFTPWFHQAWGPLRAAGLVPGAYHFLDAGADPAAQARYFVATVGSFAGVLAAVDVETGADGGHPSSAQAHAFAAEFGRLVPRHQLLLYTGRWYWRDTIGNPPGANIGPLWHSAYSAGPGPMYGGWRAPTFWQWTDAGSCPGIGGHCDLNRFSGDRAALRALAGAGQPQEPDMPLSSQDLDAIAAKLAPLLAQAADDAAKRSVRFLATGGQSSVFNPAIHGNEWMATAPSLHDVLAALAANPPAGGGSVDTAAVVSALHTALAEVTPDIRLSVTPAG